MNREDFSKLTATVERLANRMGGLEEKHDSLEKKLQKKLQKKMDTSFTDVRKPLGGLSLSVGMGLEAYALDRIPRRLEMHCGVWRCTAASRWRRSFQRRSPTAGGWLALPAGILRINRQAA